MKVLWLCNMILPMIAEKLGEEVSHKEGWLTGLCNSILENRQENQIELHVAYPVGTELGTGDSAEISRQEIYLPEYGEDVKIYGYGFYEDLAHAENYAPDMEESLKKIVDNVQPDVIHCFGTEFPHTLALLRCCRHPERVLVGMQGLCQVIADAYLADLPREVYEKVTFRDWLKKDSILEQQQKFYQRGEREKEMLRLAENVIGRTAFDRHYAQQGNPQGQYFLLNETLRNCFYEGEWEREHCEPYTIFMSQGDYPLKGLHYMLLAASKLQKKYPELRIKIAGNSLVRYRTWKEKIKISAYGKYLRKLIKDNGLEDCVEFLGRLSGEEMKAQYLNAGLYVCCSSNENSPNSLGEAMLLGMPCVAADVGGIPSIFVNGEDGILYEGFRKSENPDETDSLDRVVRNLTDAVSYIWEHPEETDIFTENARKHARNTHDKAGNYWKMMEIYAKIAGGQSGCGLVERDGL